MIRSEWQPSIHSAAEQGFDVLKAEQWEERKEWVSEKKARKTQTRKPDKDEKKKRAERKKEKKTTRCVGAWNLENLFSLNVFFFCVNIKSSRLEL